MSISKLSRDRKEQLLALHWAPAIDAASHSLIHGHRILGQVCAWWDGQIHGADRSAWIADSGDVFLHGGPDMGFDEFVKLLTTPQVSTRARGLFDLTEDE